MKEAGESCPGSEAAMWLASFFVGIGGLPVGGAMPQRMGTQAGQRWNEGTLQSRGHRDSIAACGVLKCSPEFVKPCSLAAAMSLYLFLLFQWSKRQKFMPGYHSTRSEVPSHPEAEGRRDHRDTRRTGQSNKRGRDL